MASIMNSKKLSQTVQRLQAKKIYLMDQLYNSVIIIQLYNQLISLIKNTQELNDAICPLTYLLRLLSLHSSCRNQPQEKMLRKVKLES